MNLMKFVEKWLDLMGPARRARLEKWVKSLPFIQKKITQETDDMLLGLEDSIKPYREGFTTYGALPETGASRETILEEMQQIKDREEQRWKEGFISGAVYHGDQEHINFLNEVYSLYSQANPLHADVWPSITKYEAEVVSMTAHLLGLADGEQVYGSISSGGTESILLAMKAYRDWARREKGITHPEMVVPLTAHTAFDKAAQYFQIKMRHIPVDRQFRADVKAANKAINHNTIVLVGSAPTFPHGVIDPIKELSDLASRREIGFHTDACLGGFILPWAEKLGYTVPPFDFRLPGVTSISADTHKYGYAAKGTSVILYRNESLRRYQYFTATDWPGGLYFSPTFSGSRPGALSAACWAAMISLGESGYTEAARKILETGEQIKQGILSIPELHILGDPLWVIAFASDKLDIYQVMEVMARKNWSLNGLFHPPAVHLCITLRHTQPGVADRFLADLRSSVEYVRAHPREKKGLAPIYGIASAVPLQGMISDLLKKYIDLLYKV